MEVEFNTGFVFRNLETVAANRGPSARVDGATRFTTEAVSDSLASEAEVRPAEVTRGRDLYSSSGYPPSGVIQKLSNFLARNWPESESLE
jgi:hypothetical protein